MSEITTKEKIFNVAIDLFSRKGYNEVSIREIAKGVGIKESSIYYHYSKKEDILDNIFKYYLKMMNKVEISEEQMEELLNQNPKIFYHFGSEAIKKQYATLKMTKILRLIFIELYHNEKIREFFLSELINKPIWFWTLFFQRLIDKKIIEPVNPKKLAENYYNYAMFKMFEAIILKYPEDPREVDIGEIFDNIENHFDFIFASVAINKKLIKYKSYKRTINKTIIKGIAINKNDIEEVDDENNNL
ncbi:MAG: TetR/AcrR family transcriptional regulator [Methanobacteriaceae archaeon]|jgi:AcrR family transcriptional regulator|nr:TetR/AcrR family transcriptional regulator [Candidatus Methanorudis spinitermitis]